MENGRQYIVDCPFTGGFPDPWLRAFFHVDKETGLETRSLAFKGTEIQVSARKSTFTYLASMDDIGGWFECKATQSLRQNETVFVVTAKSPRLQKVFFRPVFASSQPQVHRNVDSERQMVLQFQVKANPLPARHDIQWMLEASNASTFGPEYVIVDIIINGQGPNIALC